MDFFFNEIFNNNYIFFLHNITFIIFLYLIVNRYSKKGKGIFIISKLQEPNRIRLWLWLTMTTKQISAWTFAYWQRQWFLPSRGVLVPVERASEEQKQGILRSCGRFVKGWHLSQALLIHSIWQTCLETFRTQLFHWIVHLVEIV